MSGTAAAVVGAGPAGLMAAEALQAHGVDVHVFDAMPSVGRKFLLAGIGGLNLTHSEALPAFRARYAQRADALAPALESFVGDGVAARLFGERFTRAYAAVKEVEHESWLAEIGAWERRFLVPLA